MACLLAELRANREEMRTNQERMEAKSGAEMITIQEKTHSHYEK